MVQATDKARKTADFVSGLTVLCRRELMQQLHKVFIQFSHKHKNTLLK